MDTQPTPPPLPAVKGCYPFRLGTTSFILQDERLPNARFLASVVDEVELLFFESRRTDSLPTRQEIDQLATIGRGEGLLYNVHLPLDLFVGDADANIRSHGVEAAKAFISRTAPLDPTCWVLHLDWQRPDGTEQHEPQAWVERLHQSLTQILATGVCSASIVVENLMYPFELVTPLARELDLRLCLDIGHLLLFETDPLDFFQRHFPLASMLHVHGVRQGKDHVSLDHLDAAMARLLCEKLRGYTGGVSLEIFNRNDLDASLRRILEWMPCPGR